MSKPNGVGNSPFWRDVSNKLDDKMGWEGERREQSGVRGIVHGVYHGAVGCKDYLTGNSEKGNAEWERAGQQFDRSKNIGNSPPRKK